MSDRTGAPLAELLERLEAQQRDLSRARAAAHAQVAGIRLTSVLLAVLPLVALGWAMPSALTRSVFCSPPRSARAASRSRWPFSSPGWPGPSAWPARPRCGPRTKRGLRRLAPEPVRVAVGEELAAAADLIAAALRAGSPVSTAVLAAGEVMAGPLSRHLLQVGHQLRLGVPAEMAWQPLVGLESSSVTAALRPRVGAGLGSRRANPVWAGPPTCGRPTRSTPCCPAGGGRLDAVPTPRLAARWLRRRAAAGGGGAAKRRKWRRSGPLADPMRRRPAGAGPRPPQARLQRSAVWLVLPLGLCFLPAFLLAGIVPVVLAVLGEVL